MRVFRGFLVGAAVALAALCLIPTEETKEAAKRIACLSNVKQRALALTMYAEDADGRFPNCARWMDATAVYLKAAYGGEGSLRCPVVFDAGFGYAFDAARSGAKAPSRPEAAPLVYDSTSLARNASDRFASLPQPGRHEGGNNVGYADGHAKAVVP